MAEVVGEEFQLGVEIDVVGQRIVELNDGTGTKFVAHSLAWNPLRAVVWIEKSRFNAESADFSEQRVVYDGDTASNRGEVDNNRLVGCHKVYSVTVLQLK